MLSIIFGDKAVLSGLITKVIQGAAGPVTAVLVLHFFSPDLQGYYYTFGSLMALQVFVELGLSAVITTFAAHEWSLLSINSKGALTGDSTALGRLAGLARSVLRWYVAGAAILFVLLTVVGAWFFGRSAPSADVNWFWPWITVCALTAMNFSLTPAWALLMGCGQVEGVNKYRLAETVVRSMAIWIAIALGASLWAASISVGVATLLGTCFLAIRYRSFFSSLLRTPVTQSWSWRGEVLPLQVKIAISWLSGYFAFSVFTPVAFYYLGPKAAGQVGMTWMFISGLSGLAATWVQVRSPRFAVLVAQQNFPALDELAKSTVGIALAVFASGGAAGIVAIAVLNYYRPDLAGRFIPIGAIAIFMFAELIHQVSMVQATYLRAFKQEPFLWISMSSGIIIGLGTLLSTESLGGYGPAGSYVSGVSVALVWGTIVFVRQRRKWIRSSIC